MLKRLLLLFLSLLLMALPAFACEHIDSGEVADDELEEVNKIPPQEGVDGSVDLACPICGEIVEQVILPALPVPAEHPASSDEEAETAPVQVSQPAAQPDPEPEPPAQPEAPAQPAQPETPVQPAQPEEPAQPAQPEAPVQPAQPEEPTQPAQPETPAQPTQPEALEQPAQPETPAQPAQPEAPASEIDAISPPQSSSSSQPPEAKDVKANEKPKTGGSSSDTGSTAGTSGGNSAIRNAGRAKTGSQEAANAAEPEKLRTFPFRRKKFQPKPGIRAEAAGVLLWPVFGTPFQSIYND